MNALTKLSVVGLLTVGMVSLNAMNVGTVGASAPTSSGKTFAIEKNGANVKIDGVKGEVVVLEWYNSGCPIVKRHYKSSHMQGLQEKYTKMGVKWYAVISSARGKQGHTDAAGALSQKSTDKSFATDIVLDEASAIGRMFEAKTTPHMIVINKEGVIIYDGAIDSNRSGRESNITPYTAQAIEAALAGKAAPVAKTQPYGCEVKY